MISAETKRWKFWFSIIKLMQSPIVNGIHPVVYALNQNVYKYTLPLTHLKRIIYTYPWNKKNNARHD